MATRFRHQNIWVAMCMGEWFSLSIPCQANPTNILSLPRESFFLLLLGLVLFSVAIGLRKNKVKKQKPLPTALRVHSFGSVPAPAPLPPNFRRTNG